MKRSGILIFLIGVLFSFGFVSAADTDGDGIDDDKDNCLEVSNANQIDADSDGYGNACDMDYNNDGLVNDIDLAFIHGATTAVSQDAIHDHNGDGYVGLDDLALFLEVQGSESAVPGPSGLDCAGISTPCRICMDSDSSQQIPNGKNIFKKGTATSAGQDPWTDECSSSERLLEVWCRTSDSFRPEGYYIDCENGCLNGKCTASGSCYVEKWENEYSANNDSFGFEEYSDARFLCYNGKFYECGWEANYPDFATKADDGQKVGTRTCDLVNKTWINSDLEEPLTPTTCTDSDGGMGYFYLSAPFYGHSATTAHGGILNLEIESRGGEELTNLTVEVEFSYLRPNSTPLLKTVCGSTAPISLSSFNLTEILLNCGPGIDFNSVDLKGAVKITYLRPGSSLPLLSTGTVNLGFEDSVYVKGSASGTKEDGTVLENVYDVCAGHITFAAIAAIIFINSTPDKSLLEWSCSSTEDILKQNLYDCPNGCQDGACMDIEETYYEGNWSCKMEPVICPPHGEQKEICTRSIYDDIAEKYKDDLREQTLVCSPGICSGCYVSKWFGDSSDNKCIPYGFRFEQQTGWTFETVSEEDTEEGRMTVREFTGDEYFTGVFEVYENNTALLILEEDFFSETLVEGGSYPLYYSPAEADSGYKVILTAVKIYYDSLDYPSSYLDYVVVETFNGEREVPDTFDAYCDIDGMVKTQKTKNLRSGELAECQNNYECDSNVCSSGVCIEIVDLLKEAGAWKSFGVRIICRFGQMMGIEDYGLCVSEKLR